MFTLGRRGIEQQEEHQEDTLKEHVVKENTNAMTKTGPTIMKTTREPRQGAVSGNADLAL